LEDLPVILVIEDDQAVQGIIEDALTEGGFEPAVAASGEEAVTLLKGRTINYRALVTDIRLRGRIDGWEVARQAREIDSALPIIYITAGHGHQWPSQGVPNSILLTKPFAPAQLVIAVFPASQHWEPADRASTVMQRVGVELHLSAGRLPSTVPITTNPPKAGSKNSVIIRD
jgi:DNA-binding response OmpR family regulator